MARSSPASPIQESEFLEQSIQGLEKVLPHVYGGSTSIDNPIPAVLSPNRNYLRAMYQGKGELTPSEMPFFAYMPNTMKINRLSFGLGAMQKAGHPIRVLPNGQDFLILHLTPVTVNVTVAFVGNSFTQAMRFSKRWLQNFASMGFDLVVHQTDYSIAIKVRGAEELTMPDMPQEGDVGAIFVYETELVMDTYTGFVHRVPGVVTIKGTAYTLDRQAVAELYNKGDTPFNWAAVELFTVRLKESNPEL